MRRRQDNIVDTQEEIVVELDASEAVVAITQEPAQGPPPSVQPVTEPEGPDLESDARRDGQASVPSSAPSALSARDEAIYTMRLLTAVSVGAVVEGTDQLVRRLRQYEQELREIQSAGDDGQANVDEDELDRLRYAAVGLIFDTQNMIGRSLALTARATETTLEVTNTITRPFRNFFLFRPLTRRVEERFDEMAERGKDSLQRWIEIGRQVEPQGRQLAAMTYEEIVAEFISTLSENPELKALVAQQSVSLAAGVRDEVRERTVTVDNMVEDITRRIFRRPPRPDLAAPPPEVQRWAGISVEDYKEFEREQLDEKRADSAK